MEDELIKMRQATLQLANDLYEENESYMNEQRDRYFLIKRYASIIKNLADRAKSDEDFKTIGIKLAEMGKELEKKTIELEIKSYELLVRQLKRRKDG